MASGTSSPRRTVASTRTPSWVTSWWARAAEGSSRAWASSMARMAGARARMASRAPARDAAASSTGSSGAKAPRGTTPDDRVARTVRTRVSAATARSTASARSRDLPTPASPASTTPRRVASAPATWSSSASRPTNGHRRCTQRPPPSLTSGPCYVVDDARVRSAVRMTATRARGRLASQLEASSPSGARVAVGRSGRADAVSSGKGSPRPPGGSSSPSRVPSADSQRSAMRSASSSWSPSIGY